MKVNNMKNYVSNSLQNFVFYLKSIGIDPSIRNDLNLDELFFAHDNMHTEDINTMVAEKLVSDAYKDFKKQTIGF